jgi:hypothetical protein
MKAVKLIAFGCLSLLVAVVRPAYAQEDSASNDEGAKSLYARQMARPGDSINLGVQYWIELHRGKQVEHVNNKMAFQSGDKIRFHLRPNINGYAYILLQSGSRGERSVLFPDASRGETNKVTAGNDYTMPTDDFLEFDSNPGSEKLVLLVSRMPIDAKAYLSPNTDGEHILIASAADGSKDLIPSKIVLAFAPAPQTSAAPPAAPEKVVHDAQQKEPTKKNDKQPAKLPVTKQHIAASNSSSRRTVARAAHASGSVHIAQSSAQAAHRTEGAHASYEEKQKESAVTVVKKDPSGVLAIEVALEHL